MAKRSSKRRKTGPQAAWERGYHGHVYWLGKTRLGKVTLHSGKTAKHKYTWEAAGKVGVADELGRAKRGVELAVEMADKQLDLFG